MSAKTEVHLGNDPFALVRSRPTFQVPVNMIKSRDDLVDDPIFVRKYSEFLTGKRPVFVTRISIDWVLPGFYLNAANTYEYVVDDVLPEDMAAHIEMIRSGDRPALHLYRNPKTGDTFPFVCADDVVSYRAYKALGIVTVPVVLLDGVDSHVDEAYIRIESVVSRNNGVVYAYIADIECPTRETVASYLGFPRPDLTSGLVRLRELVSEAKSRVKAFHYTPSQVSAIHYHHTIYSVLVRVEEFLISIDALTRLGHLVSAVPLIRSLYELSLTFYVDWVAPREMFQFFQLAAVLRDRELEAFCRNIANAKRKDGFTDSAARKIEGGLRRATKVASRVSEKGKLSPFGQDFHRDFYAFMSQIAHQDLTVTARYKDALDHDDSTVFDDDVLNTIVHICDLSVSAIVSRINEDVTP